MLIDIKDLVYGSGEYERDKIDERFFKIYQKLDSLEIRNIDEFELLEEIIFKIKEQIRIKSSNLNRIIRDRNKKISKEKLDEILNHLERLRKNILISAFNNIEKNNDIDLNEALEKESEIELDNDSNISSDNKENNTKNNYNINDEYIDDIKEKSSIKTNYYEESSLDNILEKHENEPKENKKNFNEKSKIELKRSEPIEIEKNKLINPEIEVEKDIEVIKNLIYEDDLIYVYLEENSKAVGELIIKPKNKLSINKLKETDFSYIIIFSKIFASALFDTLKAHGTNIIWDYQDNRIRIIPRYLDDNLSLKWTPKQISVDELAITRDKLINRMMEEVKQNNNIEQNQNEKVNQPQTDNKQEERSEDTLSKEDKLQQILKDLERLP